MSVRLMTALWRDGPDKQGERFVLLALADYANDAGECWPSINGLCQKTCISERGVQSILKRLEAAGWVEIQRGGGRRNCNFYRIKTPQHLHLSETETPQMDAETPQMDAINPAAAAPEPSRTIIEPSIGIPAHDSNDDGRAQSGDAKSDHDAKADKGQKRATGKRPIGEHSQPTEKDIAHAASVGIDPRREWPKFRDYHIKHETRTTDRGWRASWRTWCGKALEFAERDRSSGKAAKPARRMDWREAFDRALDETSAEPVGVDHGMPDWFYETGDETKSCQPALRIIAGGAGRA